MVRCMALGKWSGPMDVCIQDSLIKENLMVLEKWKFQLKVFMKDSGKTVDKMDTVVSSEIFSYQSQ